MPTNTKSQIAVDTALLEEACQLSGFRNQTDAATQALREFVQRRKQRKFLDLFGTIEYVDGFEHKALRHFTPANHNNKYNTT